MFPVSLFYDLILMFFRFLCFLICYYIKTSVSTVAPRHLFINNLSQLFQINLLHARSIRASNLHVPKHMSGPTPTATALAQTRHAGLLTVPAWPVSPSDYLVKSAV
jgi:hypothetical protein